MPMLSWKEDKVGFVIFALNSLQPNVPAMPRKAKPRGNYHESLDGESCEMKRD